MGMVPEQNRVVSKIEFHLPIVILNEVKSSPQGWFDIQPDVRMRPRCWILRYAADEPPGLSSGICAKTAQEGRGATVRE